MIIWGLWCQKQVSQAVFCGMQLLVHAWYTCFWHQIPHIRVVFFCLGLDPLNFTSSWYWNISDLYYAFNPLSIPSVSMCPLRMQPSQLPWQPSDWLLVLRGPVGQIWGKLVSYLLKQLIGANSLGDDHWSSGSNVTISDPCDPEASVLANDITALLFV